MVLYTLGNKDMLFQEISKLKKKYQEEKPHSLGENNNKVLFEKCTH